MDDQTTRAAILALSSISAARCLIICTLVWIKTKDWLFGGQVIHFLGWAMGALFFGYVYWFGLPGSWFTGTLNLPNLTSILMMVGAEIFIWQAKHRR